MGKCLQKFLPQAYTTVSSCQEKKGSVRTKRIEAFYTQSDRASVCQDPMERGFDGEMRRGFDGEMRRGGDWKMRRGGDWKMRRGGDWKMRREGGCDGEMGRWGDWENFSVLPSSFFLLPSSFFLLPSSFFLLTNSRARHPRVQWPLQVGNWEQRVQAKQ